MFSFIMLNRKTSSKCKMFSEVQTVAMADRAESPDSTSNSSPNSEVSRTTAMTGRKEDTWLVRLLDRAFRSLGFFVADHAIAVLIIMTIVAIATSAAMARTEVR